MRHKGSIPHLEESYANVYNLPTGRFTSEDFRNLGEVIYKGISGLAGANFDDLDRLRDLVVLNLQ